MELLIFILAMGIWAAVYWPVYLVMRFLFQGSNYGESKAAAFAMFWPITVPLGLLLLAVLSFLLRDSWY